MTGKRWILILCVLIVAAVAVLASSLHDVHFEPGKPIAFENTPSPLPPALNIAETIEKTPLWKILLFWLAFVINLILFFWLIPADLRKRLIRQMLSLALGSLAILMALRYGLIELPLLHFQPPLQDIQPQSGVGGNTPVPAFSPPQMAPWWVFLVSFVVLAALLLLLWVAYRWWMRSAGRGLSELDTIRGIAESSLGELASGSNWTDVIIQSYSRMSEAVRTSRGLQRPRASTPREFAERLEAAGLPAHAVARLTRLFEAARYGAAGSTQADINEAVACLNSILQACGQSQ